GWKGNATEQAFLREAQGGACDIFKTVLGPGYNRFHADHFHLDLMQRKSGKSYCNPAAQRQMLPQPPMPNYENVPMAQGPGWQDQPVALTSVTPSMQTYTGAVPAQPTLQGYGYPQPQPYP